MIIAESATLLVRFLLELAALGVLGWWGHRTGGVALAIALPVAAAVAWGAFAAPRASVDVPVMKVAVQLLVLGGAAVALGRVADPVAGSAFAAIAAADAALMAAFDW